MTSSQNVETPPVEGRGQRRGEKGARTTPRTAGCLYQKMVSETEATLLVIRRDKMGHEFDDTGCGNVSSKNTEELRVQSLV